MPIWHGAPTLASITNRIPNTIEERLGFVYTGIGDDWISASMPVDHRTVQPMRLLQGGASVVLAESLGSLGAALTVDLEKYSIVGLDINANHVRGVPEGGGPVHGVARPVHRGGRTQVWQIEITNPAGKLVCISRLTVAVLAREPLAVASPGPRPAE